MSLLMKNVLLGVASMSVAASCFIAAPASASQQEEATDVQLISDVEAIAAGGEIPYHILYHNVQNKNVSHVQLKVTVPHGLDVDTVPEDCIWDAATRVLTWNLKNIQSNGAHVFHFHLKVKGDVKIGDEFDLDCELSEDGKVKFKTPKVKVRTGNTIDQPFFAGYPDGKFHPTASLTRAEAAAVIARVKGLADNSTASYKDLAGGHWAAGYINKVTNAGYMTGYPDGTFRPDQPISRAELVSLVLTMRGVRAVPLNGFDDTKEHWAKQALATAKELKFIDGVGKNRFEPNAPTERQAAAKMFDVALFRGPLRDGVIPVTQHFPDVPRNSWAFGWVEEASTVAHEAERKGNGIERLIRYLPDQTQPM